MPHPVPPITTSRVARDRLKKREAQGKNVKQGGKKGKVVVTTAKKK